jgi:preprotein translocase subunit SecG
MESFVAIVHVLTALSLIALVLVQDSKSDGLGSGFGGGGSNSILGATGATTLAQKMTRGAAVIFAFTSIGLTILSNQRNSVIDNLAIPPAAKAPATPGTPVDSNAPAGSPTAPTTDKTAPEAPATK